MNQGHIGEEEGGKTRRRGEVLGLGFKFSLPHETAKVKQKYFIASLKMDESDEAVKYNRKSAISGHTANSFSQCTEQ